MLLTNQQKLRNRIIALFLIESPGEERYPALILYKDSMLFRSSVDDVTVEANYYNESELEKLLQYLTKRYIG